MNLCFVFTDNVETAINTFDAGLRDHFYQTVVLAGAQTMSAGKYVTISFNYLQIDNTGIFWY